MHCRKKQHESLICLEVYLHALLTQWVVTFFQTEHPYFILSGVQWSFDNPRDIRPMTDLEDI